MLRRALCASVVLVAWSSLVMADPRPIDGPPQHGNQDLQFALVMGQLASYGASCAVGLHNLTLARGGNRSPGWSLLGLAVGATSLGVAASAGAGVGAVGAAVGVFAIVASVRLAGVPSGQEGPHAHGSTRGFELRAGLRTVTLATRF